MNETERDRRWLERVVEGDSAALAELYDHYADLLYSLALRIVGSASDAEEVLQDSWLQVWRSAKRYDPARGSVGAWLVTIARSRALDRVRSMGSRRRAEGAASTEPAADPAAGYARRMLRKDVASAITALAPQQRQVVEMAYFEGLSQTEIAAKLDAPLGTVKSWTRQALLKLRERVPVEALP